MVGPQAPHDFLKSRIFADREIAAPVREIQQHTHPAPTSETYGLITQPYDNPGVSDQVFVDAPLKVKFDNAKVVGESTVGNSRQLAVQTSEGETLNLQVNKSAGRDELVVVRGSIWRTQHALSPAQMAELYPLLAAAPGSWAQLIKLA